MIRIAAPLGEAGDNWGDTVVSEGIAKALRKFHQNVTVVRDRQPLPVADVVVVLRGLIREHPVPGAVNVLWIMSHPDLVTEEELQDFDVVCSVSASWATKMTESTGIPIQHLMWGVDHERFLPIAGVNRSGTVFVGTTRRQYRPAAIWTVEMGLPVDIYGPGWEEFISPDKFHPQGWPSELLAEKYASSNIVLNDHWADMAREGFISNRVYEATATGAVVVTDQVAGIQDVSPELVRVFTTREDLRAALTAPLPDEAVRLQAAALVREKHSLTGRAQLLSQFVTDFLVAETTKTPRRKLLNVMTRVGYPVISIARSRLPAQDTSLGAASKDSGPPESNHHHSQDTPSKAPVPKTPFSGLTGFSEALLDLKIINQGNERALNLLLFELREDNIFAGVQTAVEFAQKFAEQLSIPLRILVFQQIHNRARIRQVLADRMGLAEIEVVDLASVAQVSFGNSDIWLATYWVTAHALMVADTEAVIPAKQVVYLVQDYEPGFLPLSTDSALAAATYHAGFQIIANSTPLWNYLKTQAGLDISEKLVFAPSFDLDSLAEVASQRGRSERVRIFFYARPSKPRNMYALGIAALRYAALELSELQIPFEVVLAGEAAHEVNLGPVMARHVGLLNLQEYYSLLANTDLGLSLQASPHPSHPPFDLAISGAWAVTNEVNNSRTGIHPRIDAVLAEPVSLGKALVARAQQIAGENTLGEFQPATGLGHKLSDVVHELGKQWLSKPR